MYGPRRSAILTIGDGGAEDTNVQQGGDGAEDHRRVRDRRTRSRRHHGDRGPAHHGQADPERLDHGQGHPARIDRGEEALRRRAARAGEAGYARAAGPRRPGRPAGPKGDPGSGGSALSAGNWGVINRNTIHSPAVELRSGPFTPPLGKGSLNLAVADGTEKAAWGNEVDYANKPLALSAVGFHVYNTGENTAVAGNMPSIAFEIDPNVDAYATNYSTLVYTPAASPANAWSGYIDATQGGFWGLTGGAFNSPATQENCGLNGPRCSFAQVMDLLDDGGDAAKILTVAVTKGRDYEWHGAVDGLRINDKVFDFEETGVVTRTP